MGYATLVTLDSTILSNHGRKFEEKTDERSTEVQLANGHTRKYIKYIGREWQLSWTWLPNDDEFTTDGESGRDTLKDMIDGAAKTLIVYEADGNSNTYTVFITDYQENLLRRYIPSQRSFWDISMSLKEV